MAAQIYSIGDGQFLTNVIDSMALITQSNSFTILSATGFLIGVLWVGVQGVMSGGREFKIQNIFIAMIAWMIFFGSTTEAIIEDAETGQVRVVANVPTGIAYTGEVVSIIGHGLTELFETAFTTPSMYEGGYAKQLRVVGLMERMTLGNANTSAANGGDRLITMINYMNDCFLDGIETNSILSDTVLRAPNLLDAIQYINPNKSTLIFLPNGPSAGEIFSCTDAYLLIKDDLLGVGSNFPQRIYAHLNGVLKVEDSEQYLTDMLNGNALTPFGATPIQYIINSFINQHINDAIEARSYAITGVNRYEIMMKQAIEQRNVQWSADKNLFTQTSSSLMTFFEAVMYAVAPFLAFIIALGPSGFGLAGQYLKFAIWIQLWGPVIAIINFYILSAFAGRMDALSSEQNINAFSIEGLSVLSVTAADWLAVGSMLIAATPAITLMLLFGGVHTAVALSERMRGSDHVRESITARDKYATAPMVTGLGGAQITSGSPIHGTGTTGAPAVERTINTANTQSVANASIDKQSQANGINYSKGVSNSADLSFTDSNAASQAANLRASHGTSQSATDSAATTFSNNLLKDVKMSESDKNESGLILAASAQASFNKSGSERSAILGTALGAIKKLTGVDIGAKASATASSKHTDGTSETSSIGDSFMQGTSNSGAFTMATNKALNKDRASGTSNTFTIAANEKDMASYSSLTSETNSREKGLTAQKGIAASIGSSQNTPISKIGLDTSSATVARNEDLIQDAGLTNQYNSAIRAINKNHPSTNQNSNQVRAMAAFSTIEDGLNDQHFQSKDPSGGMTTRALNGLNNQLTEANGGQAKYFDPATAKHTDLNPNNAANTSAISPPSVRGEVQQNTADAEGVSTLSTPITVMDQQEEIGNKVNSGSQAISNFKESGIEQLQNQRSNNSARQSAATVQAIQNAPENNNIAGTTAEAGGSIIKSPYTAAVRGLDFASGFINSGTVDGGLQKTYEGVRDEYKNESVPTNAAVAAGMIETGYLPENLRSDNYNEATHNQEYDQALFGLLGVGNLAPQQQQSTLTNFGNAVDNSEYDDVRRAYQASPAGQAEEAWQMNSAPIMNNTIPDH